MKNKKADENGKKSAVLTLTGAAIMILLTATKVMPSSKLAGYSVFVGIAFFFAVEAVAKTPRSESGLRFSTVFADLKKPGVTAWLLLPILSGAAASAVGYLIFGGEFEAHVIGRAGEMLSFDKTALLIVQLIVAAFGEEIAYRGFFLGKGMKLLPFWACAAASSAVFAAGHIAEGSIGVVLFDVACVFIDSMIFSEVYRRSGNCVVSTLSHIVANAFSLAVAAVFF